MELCPSIPITQMNHRRARDVHTVISAVAAQFVAMRGQMQVDEAVPIETDLAIAFRLAERGSLDAALNRATGVLATLEERRSRYNA